MANMKTWFITGCDSGMGHVFAETILQHGDKVVITARSKANIADLLNQYPDTAFGFELDVTNIANIREVVQAAEKATGGVEVLVNNAGYGVLGAAEETSPEEYRAMFEVNFFGLAEVTRAFLPFMRSRRKGHIFNTSSSGGYAASPGFAFYAASKYAVEGFSDALAQELDAFGIRVTILEPGSTRTNFAGSSLRKPANSIPAYSDTAVTLTTTRMAARDGTQPGDPKRIAKVLIRLASEAAPPMRIPLGADSIQRLEEKAAAVAAEFRKWKPVSLSIAFDAPELPGDAKP